MFKSSLATAAAAATLGCFAATADAASINFGPTSSSARGAFITFSNLVAPSSITGDATFTFSVRGDLNWYGEYVDVAIDGFSLGRVLDNNSANDPFNVPGDLGNQNQSNTTATATISNADLAPLIADGLLTLTFDFSTYVDFGGSVNTLFGNISYDSTPVVASSALPPAPVPLPAGLPMLFAGLAAFGVLRGKKQR